MTTKRRTTAAVAFSLTASTAAYAGVAPPVPDATGTWEGNVRCTEFESAQGETEAARTVITAHGTLQIDQSGNELDARVDVSGTNFKGDDLTIEADLCGYIVGKPFNPWRRGVGAVGVPIGAQEVILSATLNEVRTYPENFFGVSGHLAGRGPLAFGDSGDYVVSDCKWHFKRTDEISPPLDCEDVD